METKLHWTQTPEGKARMSRIQKKAWKKKTHKGKSKAETVIAREVKKVKPSTPDPRLRRRAMYLQAVDAARDSGELGELGRMMADAAMIVVMRQQRWGGK